MLLLELVAVGWFLTRPTAGVVVVADVVVVDVVGVVDVVDVVDVVVVVGVVECRRSVAVRWGSNCSKSGCS